MKQFISIALLVLLLTSSFVGCTDKGNVSDEENGSITEEHREDNTTRASSTSETTRSTSESSTRESSSAIGSSESNDMSEGSESSDSSARGRMGNGLF